MKTKNRNLLTVILAMLCAVAIALGVGFVLPEMENISANAAAPTITWAAAAPASVTSTTSQLGCYQKQVTSNSYWAINEMGTPNSSYGTCSLNPNYSTANGNPVAKATLARTIYEKNTATPQYVHFKYTITIPAYTKYSVTYSIYIYNYATASSSSATGYGWEDFYWYGETDTASTIHFGRCNDGSEVSYSGTYVQRVHAHAKRNTAATNSANITSTYDNNTALAKTFTGYCGFFANCNYGSSYKYKYDAYATVTPGAPTLLATYGPKKPTCAANTKTYNGSLQSFAISDIGSSTLVSVEQTVGGNINILYSNTGTGAVIGTNPISGSNFNVTNAGVYKLQFKRDSAATAWNDGDTNQYCYVTVTMNPKAIAVPSVTNSPQQYNPSGGSSFTLNGNYNAALMTASAVSPGATWNAGSSRFEATAVGSYTVQFALIDKNNYVWSVGTGTSANQNTTIKVEPKKLNIPTVTAPQEYTGGPLSFTLSSAFDGGTYIQVDNVSTITGANGCVALGVGGTGITGTTDTFEATDVDVYKINLSLRDSANYQWTDGTNDVKDVEFEVTRKELLSTPPVSSAVNAVGAAEWQFGDNTVTMTVTDNRISGQNPTLAFYYDDPSNTLTGIVTGNTITVGMPDNIGVGNHIFYVELNGDNNGDNKNYKLSPPNNLLTFNVTAGTFDPAAFDWTYTKDGAPGGTSANDGSLKLPFELKAGSATDGVEYELSIQVPSTYATTIVVDTAKYVNGYQLRLGSTIGTYNTVVALKSNDPAIQFDVGGVMQNTIDITFSWEIEKGTFDMTAVIWEYSLDNGATWTDYDALNPPQYNDGNYVHVRVKPSSLPSGLTLDAMYDSDKERFVTTTPYTATIQPSDFVYDSSKFNTPVTSGLSLDWLIVKKNLFNNFKNVSDNYLNGNGSGTIIRKELNLPVGFEDYVDYSYYRISDGAPLSLADIKAEANPSDEKQYKVEAYIKAVYAANYEVSDGGLIPSAQFKTGSQNELANVTLDGVEINLLAPVVYDGNGHFDSSLIQIKGDVSQTVITDFTVTYYNGATPAAGNELAAGELPANAGDYCVEITLGSVAESVYILAYDWFTVKITPRTLVVPTIADGVTLTFNGEDQQLVNALQNFDPTYMEFGSASVTEAYHAGSYKAVINIKDEYKGNYVFVMPAGSVSGTKKPVKGLVDDAVNTIELSDGGATAQFDWTINKYVIDTSDPSAWNFSKEGATLSYKGVPQSIIALTTGDDPRLVFGVNYFDKDHNALSEVTLNGGSKFYVAASVDPDCADAKDVEFKNQAFDPVLGRETSPHTSYTVPQNGIAAIMNKVKDFMTQMWMGLPIWAWLAIALAVLILLIIIIAVACKRRKTKEEKAEIKARKEEERQRKEEEKRRREEEREDEKRRKEEERAEEKRRREEQLEHEREMARAKQEAELEKIRAQVGMAGMATMAVAQPQAVPAQQPVIIQQQPAQPVQQPIQQVQSVDNELLREMRQQMAELRADNKATQTQLQAMQNNQQQPQPMPMAQPMYQQYPQYPMYQQMPMQMPMMPNYGGDPTLARLEAQLNAMQAEQRARYDAEQRIELAAMRAESHVDRDSRHSVDLAAMREHINGHNYNRIPDYSQPAYNQQPNSMDMMGALVAATLRNMANGEIAATQAVPELPQKTETAAPAAKYPSDAVITTTTTVDTTKNKPLRREEDDGRIFDSDGFYDPLD
ncbi:MAG: hypothetical protein K2N22_03665 [Clostridia bacterium]|nr:hypothetical protein [Clostridia bacterium]